MALTNKLTAIADAIRSKTGKTDAMTLDQMPTEIEAISGGGGWAIPDEAFELKNKTSKLFYGGSWDWFLELCGPNLNFDGVSNLYKTFSYITLSEIPIKPFKTGDGITNCQYTFQSSKKLIKAPKITGIIAEQVRINAYVVKVRNGMLIDDVPEKYRDAVSRAVRP